MTQLRLALVTAFPPGRQSLNEYGLHLVRGFAARPDVAEVVVLADRLSAAAVELDLGPKVRVERVWRFNDVTSVPRCLGALMRLRPDGVIWNLQAASFGDRELPAGLGLCAPALSRVAGLRGGVIAHNIIAGVDLDQTPLKGAPVRQAIVRAAGRIATRAMLGADYTTTTLRGYLETLKRDYPKAEVHLVPHGTFEMAATGTPALAARPRRIVTMGKFGTYKRLETLFAAFALLRHDPRHRDIELVVGGGDHPATPGYVAAAMTGAAKSANIHFHGYVAEDDVPGFFAGARASVFDYRSTTGSSGVLHQTAAYGAVPIFPRIGDFVDLCRDEGLGGLHYDPGDAAGLARAITRAVAAPDDVAAIAAANLRAATEMPFADVIDFHVARIRALTDEGAAKTVAAE